MTKPDSFYVVVRRRNGAWLTTHATRAEAEAEAALRRGVKVVRADWRA